MTTLQSHHVDMIRTQIQLEPSELDRIKQAAAQEACSVSHYIRESVLDRLSRTERSRVTEAVRELGGKYRSGVGDLSSRHDDYLDEGW
jgi:hypothetical protein